MQLLEPKSLVIDGKEYIISKFPAIAGREIIAKYPLSGLPKLGDYEVNQETMLKLMSYVAVDINGQQIRLTQGALVDNHVKDWETLAKIEIAMLEYNCSFFQNGRALSLLKDFAQNLPQYLTKILTPFSQQSSAKTKRH